MSASAPKLMLKVELPNETDIKFTLIQVSYLYANKLDGSKFLFTNNGWTIYHGKNFSLNKKQILSLPESCLRQESKVRFDSNEERYEYLKGLANALEFWSKSHIFKKLNLVNKVKINFHKSLWIIF